MSVKKRLAIGAFWVSIDTWSGQLAQVAAFLLLSRLLGPEDYGVMGLALIVTVGAEVLIASGGWDDAIARRGKLSVLYESSIFWFLFAMGVVLAAVVALLAAPAAAFFGTPALGSLLPWLALTLPLSVLSVVPRARLRRDLAFAPLALRGILSQLVAGTVAVGLALGGAGIWSLVVLQVLQPLTDAVVIWTAARWRPALSFSFGALRDALPFVGFSLVDRIVTLCDALVQRSLIGLALGTLSLGLFTFARKILELLLQSIMRPLSRLLLPSATLLRDDPKRLAVLVSGAAEMAGLVVFPAAAGLAMTAADLLPLVVGPAWDGAVPLLQAMMVVAAMAPFSQITTSLNYFSGNARREAGLSAASAVLMTGLLLILGRHSLDGVSLALVVRATLMLPLRFVIAHRTTGLDVTRLCRPALAPLGAALCMLLSLVALGLLLPPDLGRVARLGVVVPGGALVYGAAVLLLARPALQTALGLARSLRSRDETVLASWRELDSPASPKVGRAHLTHPR